VSLVTGPDIKAENDFGKTTVSTVKSTATAKGSKLVHRFPAHSYTMLRGKLA
jgi:alpha-N-arabinofuranosidase